MEKTFSIVAIARFLGIFLVGIFIHFQAFANYSAPLFTDPKSGKVFRDNSALKKEFVLTGSQGFDPRSLFMRQDIQIPQSTWDSGSQHSCIIDAGGLKCWGLSDYFEKDRPQLNNPRKVFALADGTCAIDVDKSGKEEVKCWGCNSKSVNYCEVPYQFKNLKTISQNGPNRCALDDSGVTCWGPNNLGQLNIPHLVNPRQLGTGSNFACALDDTGVKCWGYNPGRADLSAASARVLVPELRNPRLLAVGDTVACALDDVGVKCWGSESCYSYPYEAIEDNFIWAKGYKKNLFNPRMLAVSGGYACALDDEGLKCWSGHHDINLNLPESLKVPNIRYITVEKDQVCVLNDGGIQCEHLAGMVSHGLSWNDWKRVKPIPKLVNPK